MISNYFYRIYNINFQLNVNFIKIYISKKIEHYNNAQLFDPFNLTPIYIYIDR